MKKNILITGGSGFLGSHLISRLSEKYSLTVLDEIPIKRKNVEWIGSNLTNRTVLKERLKNTDTVIHLASRNGIENSMICPTKTIETNVLTSTILYEEIRDSNVKKVILTSSTTVYGEGSYKCNHCHEHVTPIRDYERYRSWECHCENCGNEVKPLSTPENFVGKPLSFYALSKLTQEKIFGFLEYYGKIVDILRFPIVYGPGQTEKQKYPGAVGTFIKNAIEGKEIQIWEDGYQLRDFLYVDDCVTAIEAMINRTDKGQIFNIATGKKNTLLDLCIEIEKNLDKKPIIKILNGYRAGDSRHNVIGITKAIGNMGFSPNFSLKNGIEEMIRRVLQVFP